MTTVIVVVGGIVTIALLVVGLIVTNSRESGLLEDRLTQYLGEDSSQEVTEDQRRALSDWVTKRVERTSFGSRVSQSLARADIKLRVGEYFALIFMSVAVQGGIALLLGGRNIISFLIGAAVGALPVYPVNVWLMRRRTQIWPLVSVGT